MNARLLVVLIPVAVLMGCERTEAPPPDAAASAAPPAVAEATTAAATLAGASGASAGGELQFTAAAGGVNVTGQLTGLPPGSEHGFHLHERGDCSAPDAKSAGEHFNPDSAPHGGPTAAARHLGDLPNVKADDAGGAAVDGTIAGATLRDGGPHDLVGKAVIVHAKVDDYTTQPSGNSGDRIACGIVQ
jgi:Cu-Zn family superoxide dismutase